MADTSARMLRLLALLQSRRDWSGPRLAETLGVSPRTLRSDIDRLRGLGYPVEARPGVAGGYRLGSGGALPPLLLDDEEAVAVAVALATATGSAVTGVEDAALRALAKLRQVLPSRLRGRVSAVASAALAVGSGAAPVDPALLSELALACRDHVTLRFDYVAHGGAVTRRSAEPYRLVHDRGRWYLFAWDVDRADWRVFRADRVSLRIPAGRRFLPRQLPDEDEIAARVRRGADRAPWHYRARVVVEAPAAVVRGRLPASIDVEPVDEERCAFLAGSDDPEIFARYLGMLGLDFTVEDAPELRQALREQAERFRRAAGD